MWVLYSGVQRCTGAIDRSTMEGHIEMNNGIRQHKNLAVGESIMAQDSNFGVAPFSSVNGGGSGHPDRDMKHKPMKDGARGIGRPVDMGDGRHPTQAHPDHGPHHPGGFGVGSIPR